MEPVDPESPLGAPPSRPREAERVCVCGERERRIEKDRGRERESIRKSERARETERESERETERERERERLTDRRTDKERCS